MDNRNISLEPVSSQLVRHCDLLRRACMLTVDMIGGRSQPIDAGAQMERLRNQSLEMKQRILDRLPHPSFIEQFPEDAGKLALALDALMGSVAQCGQIAARQDHAAASPAAFTAANLILRCAELIHDCSRRRNVHGAGERKNAAWDISSGIPMVETELGRVLQQTALRYPPDTHLIQALRSAAIHCREVTAIIGRLCPAPARSSGGLATVERRATASGVVHGSAVL